MTPELLKHQVVIASIWPERMVEKRSLYGRDFVIEAGSVEHPAICVVEDVYQSEYTAMTASFGPLMTTPKPVLARAVADDLVRCWTTNRGNTSDTASPGIWVCAGDGPSKEEIDEHAEKQRQYQMEQVEKGDTLFRDNRSDWITTTMRVSAKALGMMDRLWIRELRADNFTSCPACKEQIIAGALKCKHCSTVIPEFLETMKKFTPPMLGPPMKPIPGRPAA